MAIPYPSGQLSAYCQWLKNSLQLHYQLCVNGYSLPLSSTISLVSMAIPNPPSPLSAWCQWLFLTPQLHYQRSVNGYS
jgi:hypothetical protein